MSGLEPLHDERADLLMADLLGFDLLPNLDWAFGGVTGAKSRVELFQRFVRVIQQLDLHRCLTVNHSARLRLTQRVTSRYLIPCGSAGIIGAARISTMPRLNPIGLVAKVPGRHPSLMIDLLYRAVKPILFRLDAETAHRLTLAMLAALPAPSAEPDSPELRTRVFGLDFDNPVGLAAGMDKDAIAVHTWRALGFGFAELGTITPLPQPGNPRPRIFRVREHRALINRLGFPSEGMDAVGSRVARATAGGARFRIGLNFGPNKD